MTDHITYGPWKGALGKGLALAELQYLLRVACGMTDKEIARECGRSPEGIKSRLKNAAYKLHAWRRPQVVAEALRLGIISPLVVVLSALLVLAPAGTRDNVRPARAPRAAQSVRIVRHLNETAGEVLA